MAECLTPFAKKNRHGNQTDQFPCGKCPPCFERRRNGWAFRISQENKRAMNNYFLTLTYDEQNCPITENGFMVLNKKHLQGFFKRLRSSIEFAYRTSLNVYLSGESCDATEPVVPLPVKYYAVGEYGGKSLRPHYHIIIFNVDLELMMSPQDFLWLEHYQYDGKWQVQCKQWDYGHMTVGRATDSSISYVTKYMTKKSRIPMHMNDDRIKEFSLMSKGIGSNYVGDFLTVWCGDYVLDPLDGMIIEIKKRTLLVRASKNKEWHLNDLDNRMYVPIEDGKKIAMPRYYKQKIYNDVQRKIAGNAALKKLEATKEREAALGNAPTARDKAESDISQFKKMWLNAEEGRNKIENENG